MDIAYLKEGLKTLMDLDPTGDYKYINAPLSEAELTAIETEHGFRFPEDYRAFLNQMFDGGVGPEQIMPIGLWDAVHNTVNLGRLGNSLSRPFPFTEALSFWEADKAPKLTLGTTALDGTIRICHIGSGNFIFLVVNGREYGNLWVDDMASNDEMFPLSLNGKPRVSFGEWYMDWLEEAIRSHRERVQLYVQTYEGKNYVEVGMNFSKKGTLLVTCFTNFENDDLKEHYKAFGIERFSILEVPPKDLESVFSYFQVDDKLELLQKFKATFQGKEAFQQLMAFFEEQCILLE